MFDKTIILRLADAYGAGARVSEKTTSHRVFRDSKKLTALRNGSDITLERANDAWLWFNENWPDGSPWPAGVVRPPSPAESTAA